MEGLLGLVVLGNAWQSVDVFHVVMALLADITGSRETIHSSLGGLAQCRVFELVDHGHSSFDGPHPDSSFARMLADPTPGLWVNLQGPRYEEIRVWYDPARQASDQWQSEHDAWVRGRLEEGLHPDLDPVAFGEFRAVVLPVMPDPIVLPRWASTTIELVKLPGMALVAMGVALWMFWLAVRAIRVRRTM